MSSKNIIIVLAAIFIIGIMFSSYKIYKIQKDYKQGINSYTELKGFVEFADLSEKEPEESAGTEKNSTAAAQFPIVDFEALSNINSDIVGWLYFNGTVIDYPIVQGEDNSFYLNHLFDKNCNASGCIFLDCNNNSDFSDYNNVVYGHHMKNGTMFSILSKYKDQEYFDAHPQAMLMTPAQNYIIDIFSGNVVNADDDDAWQISFGSDTDFIKWLTDLKEHSCFKSGVNPAVSDKIITFSTCSYEYSNARFVLYGILR